MIHIYYGDGKGKTSAAIGLCIRAIGHGIPVLFIQFLKDSHSGEIEILQRLPGIHVMHPERHYGFSYRMTQEEKKDAEWQYLFMLGKALAFQDSINEENAAADFFRISCVIVLDEILHAISTRIISERQFMDFLGRIKPSTELVLTGMAANDSLLQRADYITEMKKKKHPFDKGVLARAGIEE